MPRVKRQRPDESAIAAADRAIAQSQALTPEARENQVINRAYDLAERRIIEGTASDTLLSHFLKMGSTKARIEKEILESEKELVIAKKERLQSEQRSEEMFAEAMAAMKHYSGQDDEDDDEENIY